MIVSNEEIFIMFLKKHRKYKSFKKQKHSNMNYYSNDHICKIGNPIDRGLIWCLTAEGSGYWYGLHKKWGKLVKDFNLKDHIDLTQI